MERYQILTDEQFALIEPILKEERDPRGRKPIINDRQVLDTLFCILREGCSGGGRFHHALGIGWRSLCVIKDGWSGDMESPHAPAEGKGA